MEAIFHFRVRAVIIDENSILVARMIGKNYTFLPGGHIEIGESAPLALRRELKEEIGVDAEDFLYLGAIENAWLQDGIRNVEMNHIFRVVVPGLTAHARVLSLEDRFEFMWINIAELENAQLLPKQLPSLIRKSIAGDRSPWWGSSMIA